MYAIFIHMKVTYKIRILKGKIKGKGMWTKSAE